MGIFLGKAVSWAGLYTDATIYTGHGIKLPCTFFFVYINAVSGTFDGAFGAEYAIFYFYGYLPPCFCKRRPLNLGIKSGGFLAGKVFQDYWSKV